ncbi:glycosyltransferase family 2 protein [Jannaschia sp. M317]|uniref:glycosyltransferase family 2 protein n=1 Tax=Jannaschia sp. M317 TaxID=2867011 RepID=UPI0021A5EAA1|nr:glycosyltransferase family 2 protein [Jannaschia sp. M317]UWQ19668.1 glycosyltransferase family 2 protein [Jannaschia sp. M317]
MVIKTLTHLGYFGLVFLLASVVPAGFLGDPGAAKTAVLVVGVLGAWRYSWAAINFTRAIIFRRIVYPRWKRQRQARFDADPRPSHCYFMVTTYMVDVDITLEVYRSIFRAAAAARDGATIVASVVDGKDARLIRDIFQTMPVDMTGTKLIIDRISSKGKRDAMAKALRILAQLGPSHRDILVFVDGDTVVPENIWAASAPVFTDPKVGALTTDEGAVIGKEGLYKDWFHLRFDQRQVMMCSMGLANRVLTLTGRMSVFRASLATNPGFIEGVDRDYLNHWRLGRVDFLTGDDKSTWYWLLKNGYQTAYLPDVRSWSYEEQPRDTFLESAQVLMTRWFGNMMRTNGRAIRLGPSRMGFFTWWSILDQRVSMFTTLVGPISVAVTAALGTPVVIPLYISWVLMTRYVFCAYIALFRGGQWFPVTHPPILYFGQVVGAAVKTFVFFRLDRQKWTRQGAGAKVVLPAGERVKRLESTAMHVLAISWLAMIIMLVNTFE